MLSFIQGSPNRVGKRELVRAFQVSSADRPAFKALLRELEDEGTIDRGHRRKFSEKGRLPNVVILDAIRIDADGDLVGHPAGWEEKAPPPLIYIDVKTEKQSALAIGDRVLARVTPIEDGAYQAIPIRKLPGGPRQILGICEHTENGNLLVKPVDRRERQTITVTKAQSQGANHGELVLVAVEQSSRKRAAIGNIVERIHDAGIEKALSLIAIHSHGIPHEWPTAALEQAEACTSVKLGQRTDLRETPLVTIDGEDARDFDDAVWAEADPDSENVGGWHLIVAIADIAHYVHAGSPLDRVAYERGNSTYFPDRVVPMLPEALSNGWCSLRPKEDRPCLAVHLWISKKGRLKRHKFDRALMKSAARLTYEQVQAAHDGSPDDTTEPLIETVIEPLFGAYRCLEKARRKRGALALDLPERKIIVGSDGLMTGVVKRPRWPSHELIEEFMILANVAAAQTLLRKHAPGLYRVHEPPDPERVADLRKALGSMNIPLNPPGSVHARDFNHVLDVAKDNPAANLINMMILRTQSQARYEPDNLGHFGLALPQYTHFTSPIRRYSDVIVHRCLIGKLGLGDDGIETEAIPDLRDISDHISMTERRSAAAERETVDRFTAAFLEDSVGATFEAVVNGVSRFGLFVSVTDSGADGILPIKRLPNDYYEVFEGTHTLAGRNNGQVFSVGDPITVRLTDADPMTGSLAFDYVDHTSLIPKTQRRGGRGGKQRKGRNPRTQSKRTANKGSGRQAHKKIK